MTDQQVIQEAIQQTQGHIVKYIQRRVKKNKNFMACVAGQTGSGKSYCALRLAEEIDPNFNVENVVFSNKEFMKLINSGTLESGSAVVYDEAGVGQANRQWFSTTNKLFNYVAQTFRHQNYIVFFCVPDFNFVDAGTRKLFHALFEMQKINHNDKYSIFKPLLVQNNMRMGKLYFKYPEVSVNRTRMRLRKAYSPMPSKRICNAYEIKKSEFTSKLNKAIEFELGGYKEHQAAQDPRKMTDKQDEVYRLHKKGLVQKEIAKILDIGQQSVSSHLKSIKEKGWVV